MSVCDPKAGPVQPSNLNGIPAMTYVRRDALRSTGSAKARFDGVLSGPSAPLRRTSVRDQLNRRRRDAGNEYNHSLSRMVKLRRLLVAPRGAAASASRTWPASAGLAV
jgi:hypothetical protein